jgi:hypothetical protein
MNSYLLILKTIIPGLELLIDLQEAGSPGYTDVPLP